MEIRNATKEEIDKALAVVNERFGGNVIYNRMDYKGRTRQGGDKHLVTLRVTSSKGPGHRLSQGGFGQTRRRMVSACWHVHGTFYDALPNGCTIVTGRTKIQPGDRWNDWNIGSQAFPVYYSEACECEQ